MRTAVDVSKDPYMNLAGVQFLDEKLAMLEERVVRLRKEVGGESNHTSLQNASLQLIPASTSMAKSIRLMIREGYLLSAMVLFRPMMERVATLSYLADNSDAVALWEAGWCHGQRPSLRERLGSLMPGASQEILATFADAVTKYNSLVHGDPFAAQQSLIHLPDSSIRYTSDRDYATPGRANIIALETAISVVFLIVAIDRIFFALPDR
jgi:hypothetical protein